ncbi:MAG: hypothetical protein JST84_18915 [Acidobacteria bacterium]|nr:hypothetical protein [Acidobacteriota bacterium]
MKKKKTEMEDDTLPHYDLDKLPIVKRGPGYAAKGKMVRIYSVVLDPDVAKVFPDSASVNQALRLLIQAREIGVKKSSRRS